MANIGAQPDKIMRQVAISRLPILVVLLVFSGWSLNVPGLGWAPLVLALWAGIALLLQPTVKVSRAWYADADLVALEMLIASLIDQPVFGLMIAVAHAVVTQFWLVRNSS
jgi:hypothetical protein